MACPLLFPVGIEPLANRPRRPHRPTSDRRGPAADAVPLNHFLPVDLSLKISHLFQPRPPMIRSPFCQKNSPRSVGLPAPRRAPPVGVASPADLMPLLLHRLWPDP